MKGRPMDWFNVLGRHGISVMPHMIAKGEDDCARCAGKLGYPVVIKVISPDVIHKTEFGGVKLNIHNECDARLAVRAIRENMRKFRKHVDGFLVQKQAGKGVELIVGGSRDDQFGQLIVFGLGGVFVEVYKDISVRVCPITEQDAWEMITEIKAHPVLQGVRGGKPVNEKKLIELLMKTSKLLVELNPKEMDLNPVIADEKGYAVVDVRVIQ